MVGMYLGELIDKRWVRWGAALAILGVAGAYVPTTYTRTIEVGTDSFETHQALFGEHAVRQTMRLIRPTKAIGVIAVNLQQAQSLAPIYVELHTSNGVELATAIIPSSAIQDDSFAWALLGKPVSPQLVLLELAAPGATSANAIGVRFQEKTGDLALAVRESVPAWQRFILWRTDNPENADFLDRTILVGLASLLTFTLAARFGNRPWVWKGILAALVVGTVLLHLPVAQKVEGTFGGDAFNFLLKARAWIGGDDPFGIDPRRGPFLPFLLLPAYFGLDPVWLGRAINLASAGVAVGITTALAARLGMPRSVAVGAGLLLSVNREFWWQSVHGLSNIPYTALIMLSVYALAVRRSFWAAATAGLASLTRFEGALVAAVILPAAWIKERMRLRAGLRMLLIAACIAAIPFLMWPFSGKLGVRTAEDIADDPGLYLAWSPQDYYQNLQRFELFWGRLWLLVPLVGQQWIVLGIGVAVGIWMAARVKPSWLSPVIAILLLAFLAGGLAGVTLFDDDMARKQLTQILTICIGVGTGWLLLRRPKWGIPTVLMVVIQVALVTAILPKTRYYVQTIPFAALALAFGVHVLGNNVPARVRGVRMGIVGALLACTVGVAYADTVYQLPGETSGYNEHAQNLAVLIQAGRSLAGETGIVATGQHNLPLRVYVGDEKLRMYPEGRSLEPDSVTVWLDKVGAKTVVETSDEPLYLATVNARPDMFEQVAMFDSKFGPSKVWIYHYCGGTGCILKETGGSLER